MPILTKLLVFVASLGLTLALPASAQTGTVSDYRVVVDRLVSEYRQISSWQAATAIRTIDNRGEWSDINYSDRGIGAWRPVVHLERTRALAISYNTPTSSHHKSSAVRNAVLKALQAWLRRKPESDNWWHNTIGQQLVLMPILVLMENELPPELKQPLTSMLTDMRSVPPDRLTGQNLVWYATQGIVRGALERNSIDILSARDAIRTTLAVTSKEGIQADLSFHQHGNQLYSGGYGLTFLVDTVRVADWLRETPWAFSNADHNLLADYTLQGVMPLIRRNWLDWGARGRELSRQESTTRPAVLRAVMPALIRLAPERRSRLEAAAAQLSNNVAPDTSSSIAYWRSDFVAHQTPKGYFSVKMVSRRTVGTESGNGENLLGYWLPFGCTFIVQTGDEYLGLQPVLDWASMPGVTAPAVVPRFTGYLRHLEDRVGALSHSGSSLAFMQLNTEGVLAKKFWFLDGDIMVALGTDISSTAAQDVRTTINQTNWSGEATTNVGQFKGRFDNLSRDGLKWLVHGGVGYLLLDAQSARLAIQDRILTGADPTNTSMGAKPMSAPVGILTLSIDHGLRPSSARYAYAVAHGIDNPTTLQAIATPRVLANNSDQQAVASSDGRTLAVVFHKPGRVAIDTNHALQADDACALIAKLADGKWSIELIDLPGTGGTCTLRLFRGDAQLAAQTVTVPGNVQRNLGTQAASTILTP
jgi:chondroitin AC lyase